MELAKADQQSKLKLSKHINLLDIPTECGVTCRDMDVSAAVVSQKAHVSMCEGLRSAECLEPPAGVVVTRVCLRVSSLNHTAYCWRCWRSLLSFRFLRLTGLIYFLSK